MSGGLWRGARPWVSLAVAAGFVVLLAACAPAAPGARVVRSLPAVSCNGSWLALERALRRGLDH